MTSTAQFDHHSALVAEFNRRWQPKHSILSKEFWGDFTLENPATHEEFGRAVMRSPKTGYEVSVKFSRIRNKATGEVREDLVVIRSRNWRVEDEPSGIYDRNTAHNFYFSLKAAGFVLVTE